MMRGTLDERLTPSVTVSEQLIPGARTIPSLDGLRAVSIGLVLLAHAQGTAGFPVWIPRAISDHGKLGVQIFFVISGFLITTLLIRERASSGTISLQLFYARRTLRIFPPLYLFLAAISLATWMGVLNIPKVNLLAGATYTMNYIPQGVWITNHLWSLSVEEQFYLVWPVTIRLAGLRRALWIAAILAVTAPVLCLAFYLIDSNAGSRASLYFPFVADSIAAGCVLAGILPSLRRRSLFRFFGAPAGAIVIPLVLVLDLGRNHPRLHMAATELFLNVCICYAVVRFTEFPGRLAGRILNHSVLVFIGKMSYSLYLWQQIFMNPTNPSQRFPLNLVESFGCALLSYYLVETPIAGMRRRLRPAALRTS